MYSTNDAPLEIKLPCTYKIHKLVQMSPLWYKGTKLQIQALFNCHYGVQIV